MSSISGEVVKNLRFSLGPITGEVLRHLSACSRDIAAEVRAAAVMVLTMMLQVKRKAQSFHCQAPVQVHFKPSLFKDGLGADVILGFQINYLLLYASYLQGLGRDVFSVLQGTIRDVYRELKMVAATEKEDMVLAHVSLALEEIDNIVKSLFTPDNSIEKKIVVLDINN